MGVRFQSWLSTALSAILLVLVIASIWLLAGNLERQQEATKNQLFIQQIQQVEPLHRELAQALAELAHKGDAQIGSLLTTQGIQLAPQQPSAPQPEGTAAQTPASPSSPEPATRENNRRERAPRNFKPAAPTPVKPN